MVYLSGRYFHYLSVDTVNLVAGIVCVAFRINMDQDFRFGKLF